MSGNQEAVTGVERGWHRALSALRTAWGVPSALSLLTVFGGLFGEGNWLKLSHEITPSYSAFLYIGCSFLSF